VKKTGERTGKISGSRFVAEPSGMNREVQRSGPLALAQLARFVSPSRP
jgi:hypothetical protein